jgi:hypothetical protein
MAEDVLIKYQSLINELKLRLGQPHFDTIFINKTKALSSSDTFLIKMEMNRLLQPVNRIIDLRGRVTGEIRPYVYLGKQHFMDDTAIKVFEAEIRRYGRYTLAVYEAVMNTKNNLKLMQRQAQAVSKHAQINIASEESDDKSLINCVSFSSYEARNEERMNYSIKVTLILNNGASEIDASTSDLSINGCKVKLSADISLAKGDQLHMRLVGLEHEFEMDLKEGLAYQVVAVEKESPTSNYVRMKRILNDNDNAIDEFLKRFIHGNKRRYKVNMDNTIDAVVVKGYEQYYLSKASSLFIFLKVSDNRIAHSFALTNEHSVKVAHYFNDGSRNSMIPHIFNTYRVNQLLQTDGSVKRCNIYCFTHTHNGSVYFYSATESELNQSPQLAELFLGFASQQPNFRIFNMQLMPCSSEDSYTPLSLPDTAINSTQKVNKPPSARVQKMLQDIKYQLVVSDITSISSTEKYKQISYEQSHINHLKQYGHQQSHASSNVELVTLDYVNLRKEIRYVYSTEVQIEQGNNKLLLGQLVDFSIHGLQVELAKSSDYTPGELIFINLPELQKLSKKFRLTKLPYKVVAVSKTSTILNLEAYLPSDIKSHHGVGFLTQLINNNKAKLVASEVSLFTQDLATALRHIATKNVCQFPFYLHKRGASVKIRAIAKGRYPNAFHLLLSHLAGLNESFNLKNVIRSSAFKKIIVTPLKAMSVHSKPLECDLFIRLKTNQLEPNKAIMSGLHNSKEHHDISGFIDVSVHENLFFAFRLTISRTGRPDTKYIANELGYINQYAKHKATKLEDELWSIVGVGDVIDITDEVLTRYAIKSDIINNMNKRKALWSQTAQLKLGNLFD